MITSNRHSIFSYLMKISLVACLALGLAACDTSDSNNNGSSNTIDTIEFASDQIQLYTGSETQLILMAHYNNGDSEQVKDQATWQSNDTSVATVSATGMVNGVTTGTAMVTAIMDGEEATIEVVITDPETTHLQLTVDPSTIIVGLEATLTLRKFLSDGSSPIITDDKHIAWYSSNPNIAEVNAGTVIGLSSGAVTITAVLDNHHEARTVVQVRDAQLTDIQLTPHSLEVIKDASASLTLMAFYDNNDSLDVTHNERVVWDSKDSSVATVDVDAAGKVTGVATGETTIEVAFDGYYAWGSVAVFDVESVDIRCDTLNIIEGLYTQCELIGSYNNGSTTVIADDVTWSIEDENNYVVTVDDDGRVYGETTGSAIITAKFQNHKTSRNINVVDATITGLRFECPPGGCEFIVGLNTPLKLVALLDNNTEQDVASDQAGWHSSDPTVAAVNEGEVVGRQAGTAIITATLNTLQGPIPASIDITVIEAILTGVQLSADKVSVVAHGISWQLMLIAEYNDGAYHAYLTDHVEWDVVDYSTPNMVQISKGEVEGEKVGTAKISATFGGMSAEADVHVVNEGVSLTVRVDEYSNGEVNFLDENGFKLAELPCATDYPNSCQLSGIYEGRQITLQAVPDNIADFEGWSGNTLTDCDDNDSLCDIIVYDHTEEVTAWFDTPMTEINLKSNVGGRITVSVSSGKIWRTGELKSGNICGTSAIDCSIQVPARIGNIKFIASAIGGYDFDHWSDTGTSSCSRLNRLCTVKPHHQEKISLRANFRAEVTPTSRPMVENNLSN